MRVAKERALPRTPLWSWVHVRFSAADAVLMALAAVLSMVVQWPHRPLFLNIWDSFLFARAAIEYDLLGGYPHPPGYPVFVFVVKLVAMFTEPANALELVSMGFAALAVALLFGFLREFVARPAAAMTASVFALSPTLVYNGVLSLSYSAECAATIGVAWLAWRVREAPTMRGTMLLAGVFGLCAGLRTTVFLYLAPLAAWSVWSHEGAAPDRMRRFLAAAGVGFLAVLCWLLPMWTFGGGLDTWLFTTGEQSDVVVFEKTIWNGGFAAAAEQTARVLFYLEPEVSILIAGAGALALAFWSQRHEADPRLAKPLVFAIVWVGPSLLFMSLVFSGWARGPRGYALAFLPAFYMALAIGVDRVTEANLRRLRAPVSRLAAIALGCALVFSPVPFLNPEREALILPDVDGRNSWGTGWLGLRDAFLPNETAILTTHEWGFARWYFSDYVVWGYLPGTTHPDWESATWRFILEARDRKDEVPLYGVYRAGVPPPDHEIPAGVTRVVLTDFKMAGEDGGRRLLRDDVAVKEYILPNGWRILYFDVDPSRPVIEQYLLPLGSG